MDYLYYEERRAENLQFFLWYCDYVERWSRLLPHQRQMAPVWGPAEAAEAAQEEEQAEAGSIPLSDITSAPFGSIDPPPPAVYPSLGVRRQVTHSRGPSASSNRGHRNLSIDTGRTGTAYGSTSDPRMKLRSNSVASTAASISSVASAASKVSTSSLLAASIHQRSDNEKLTNILTILENLPEAAEPPSAHPGLAEPTPDAGSISPSLISPRGGAAVAAAATPIGWQQQQPYTLQPFRDELGRIVRQYISETGDRSLPDLFPPERAACFRAAKRTTHPSALLPAFLAAESALREQSFPFFVRDCCLGNVTKGSPRLVLARVSATLLFLVGVALDVVLIVLVGGNILSLEAPTMTPSSMARMGDSLARLVCLVFWWPALAILLAARRRIDLVLYLRGQLMLGPWAVEEDEEWAGNDNDNDDVERAGWPTPNVEKQMSGRPRDGHRGHRHQTSTSSTSSRIDPLRKASLQTLGPRNDPDSESWARRQAQVPFVRRLLAEVWPKRAVDDRGFAVRSSRTVAVRHAGVRAMQTQAVWAAVLWAGLASTVLAAISVFIPGLAM